MITVKEIAQRCGVSAGTVDRVLHNRGRVSEETRRKIMEVVEQENYVPNRAAQQLALRRYELNLLFIALDGSDNEFFTIINEAAETEAKRLEEFGVQVSVLRLNRGKENVLFELPENIDIDFSIIDGVASPGAVYHLIESELRPGIPIVFYNESVEDTEKSLSFVGCDYRKSGAIAAQLCAMASDEKKKLAFMTETGSGIQRIAEFHQKKDKQSDIWLTGANYVRRVSGFCKCLEERYPDFQIQAEVAFDNSYENSLTICRTLLENYPEVSVVYVINPGNYDCCRALKDADIENRIRIITNDLTENVKPLLRDGTISAVITQDPEAQGREPLTILYEYLVHGKRPEPTNYTKLETKIAENMGGE